MRNKIKDIITTIRGRLFLTVKDYDLRNCANEDLWMVGGIANALWQKFGGIADQPNGTVLRRG